jgi:MarR family transcriptional regulator for hemolysin
LSVTVTAPAATPPDEPAAMPPDLPSSWRRLEGITMSTGLAIRQVFDKFLEPLKLTLPESMVLSLVVDAGPQTQSDIARELQSGRAVTGLRIDSLEKRGLLQRVSDPNDRRVWLINATQDGIDLCAQINVIDRLVRDRIRAGTTREERRAFALTAAKFRQNIEQALGDQDW